MRRRNGFALAADGIAPIFCCCAHVMAHPRRRRIMNKVRRDALFPIGQVVKHRLFPFRGVIFDVDPEFNNTEEWWESIPENVRPRKDQPFYHLLAENEQNTYVAYVSEQNLLEDESGKPVNHPAVSQLFGELKDGRYALRDHRSLLH